MDSITVSVSAEFHHILSNSIQYCQAGLAVETACGWLSSPAPEARPAVRFHVEVLSLLRDSALLPTSVISENVTQLTFYIDGIVTYM